MKIIKFYEFHITAASWNQATVFYGAGPGRNRGPRGATGLQALDPWNPWNLMKCDEHLWKSMKIHKIATSWNRAKVSSGAGPRRHRGPQPANFRPLESMKSQEQKPPRAAAPILLHCFVLFFCWRDFGQLVDVENSVFTICGARNWVWKDTELFIEFTYFCWRWTNTLQCILKWKIMSCKHIGKWRVLEEWTYEVKGMRKCNN
jgi:hypothetical protein